MLTRKEAAAFGYKIEKCSDGVLEVSMRKDSAAGRVLGIVVFLIGIGILVTVAVIAYRLFSDTTSGLHVTPGASAGAAVQLGTSAIRLLYQIALLVVLCIAGSLLAARGLHLYFVAGSREEGVGNRE
jgi:hypothetical protein